MFEKLMIEEEALPFLNVISPSVAMIDSVAIAPLILSQFLLTSGLLKQIPSINLQTFCSLLHFLSTRVERTPAVWLAMYF